MIEPIIVQDSREQLGYGPLLTVPHIIEGLPAGDYSVVGLTERIAVERKSLPDLLGSITRGRERFEKELSKAKSYDRFYCVVECRASDILEGRYDADVHPAAAWESIAALSVRHGVPFLFAESRAVGAKLTESLLLKYAREFMKAADTIRKAAEKVRKAG